MTKLNKTQKMLLYVKELEDTILRMSIVKSDWYQLRCQCCGSVFTLQPPYKPIDAWVSIDKIDHLEGCMYARIKKERSQYE